MCYCGVYTSNSLSLSSNACFPSCQIGSVSLQEIVFISFVLGVFFLVSLLVPLLADLCCTVMLLPVLIIDPPYNNHSWSDQMVTMYITFLYLQVSRSYRMSGFLLCPLTRRTPLWISSNFTLGRFWEKCFQNCLLCSSYCSVYTDSFRMLETD